MKCRHKVGKDGPSKRLLLQVDPGFVMVMVRGRGLQWITRLSD